MKRLFTVPFVFVLVLVNVVALSAFAYGPPYEKVIFSTSIEQRDDGKIAYSIILDTPDSRILTGLFAIKFNNDVLQIPVETETAMIDEDAETIEKVGFNGIAVHNIQKSAPDIVLVAWASMRAISESGPLMNIIFECKDDYTGALEFEFTIRELIGDDTTTLIDSEITNSISQFEVANTKIWENIPAEMIIATVAVLLVATAVVVLVVRKQKRIPVDSATEADENKPSNDSNENE